MLLGRKQLKCSSPADETGGTSLGEAFGDPISAYRCELGEGLFVSGPLLAWLDIATDRLYLFEKLCVRAIDLPVKATVILGHIDEVLVVASAEGLGYVSVATGVYERYNDREAGLCASSFRTNDGCRLASGSYLVGTMHVSLPAESPGTVMLLNGGVVQCVIDKIYIPNLFVELQDGAILIADSLQGTIYRCSFDQAGKRLALTLWYQSESAVSPDGGCLLPEGRVAVAMWNGACVRIFNPDGSLFREVPVAARRPTNVKYDGSQDRVLVTSAYEGLGDAQLRRYPLSGATFSIPCSKLR